jgi:two-component system cell cycle response regulator DivK
MPTDTHRLVLIVDADLDTRMLYRTALLPMGYEVDEAEDGREGFAKAFAGKPAFIITETRLAFVDGYELCQMLRTDEKTCNIRIIVLSGDAHPDQVGRAWAAGADGVLAKPCLPETLVNEIRRLAEPRLARRNLSSVIKAEIVRASSSRRSATQMHQRFDTSDPPLSPPSLQCPSCDQPLTYLRSHIGGVSKRHPEQWDYFLCPFCGPFEYRQRTRKLRRAEKAAAASRQIAKE